MILYIIISAAIVLGLGWFLKTHVNTRENYYTPITDLEYIWTSVLILCVVVPGVIFASWKISKNNQLRYVEHLNGWETGTVHNVVQCYRDGPCHHEYDCDPYIVMVSYRYSCGKNRTCTGTRPETRYHSCPYAKQEWRHYVNTTLGTYNIDGNRLPPDYKTNPWRSRVAPDYLASRVGVGHPERWVQAKARVDGDSAGPVTKFHTYENYVLASHMTVLRNEVRQDIQKYKKDSLLPYIKRDILYEYGIDKVYPVKTAIPAGFRESVHRLSSSLGTTYKGDLRVVVVGNQIQNLDEYTNSLKSFWQSREYQDNNHALPKNSITLVIQTDGTTVTGSKAFSGMPTGNTLVMDRLSTQLKGLPFKTETLFGYPRYRAPKNIPLDSMGKVGYIMMQTDNPFQRENMGMYSYLRGDVQPSKAAKVWSVILSIVLGMLCWAIPFVLHCPSDHIQNNRR